MVDPEVLFLDGGDAVPGVSWDAVASFRMAYRNSADG